MTADGYSLQDGQHHNQRGVIADTYETLQGLHILHDIKQQHPLPPASPASVLRAILQSVEVGLLNIVDLLERATSDIRDNNLDAAFTKMCWSRGFHHLLEQLSHLPGQLGYAIPGQALSALRIADSPAARAYMQALPGFDSAVQLYLEAVQRQLEETIAYKSLHDTLAHFIQLTLLCNHITTIWEHNLAQVSVPAQAAHYPDFVVADGIRAMVYERRLKGDTMFMQFRALHQIPEILTAEINDCLEHAIRALHQGQARPAIAQLHTVNILLPVVIDAVLPIADNLTAADYHQIRENLGVTSGSHSENIHYHLFRDLYAQIGTTFMTWLRQQHAPTEPAASMADIVARIDAQRADNEAAFLAHMLGGELLRLRMFVFQWRNRHLHLPRNTVGGNFTKSLKGAPDAVQTVKNMRQSAHERDPLREYVQCRTGDIVDYASADLRLAAYFRSDTALDKRITDTTGSITKRRFRHVQERQGIFADHGKFVPPKPRQVMPPDTDGTEQDGS